MLTDYHTHTFRCGHATGRLDEYVEAAIARGIDEIGLTDHLFLYYEPSERRDLRWAMPEEDYPGHYEEMLRVRDRFANRISVRVGVEADFVAGHEDHLLEILSSYEFDLILGSVHFMDGWLIDSEEEAGRYREERVAEIYRRYFANIERAVHLGAFDVLAHLDLPKKFGFLPEEDLAGTIGATLDLVAAAGIAVEVSTAGLRKPVSEIYPSMPILHAMRQRAIPIVLSSDAHAPEEVGDRYELALAAVREAGYRSLLTFDRRVAREAPLG